MSARRGSTIPKMESREQRSPRILRTKTPSTNELRKKCKVSPKGKRKLDFPLKGPLTRKSFYLDLKGDRHSAQLQKAIVDLGGAIEEFFHKDVSYLVTNRKDADNGKSPASSHSAPSPGTPSPFLMTRSSSLKGTAVPSPMSTDSPQSVENRQVRVSHHTRGQAICKSVSGGPKRGTTDVLSNANTWGVTVFHIDQVLKWISQLMPKTRQHNSGKQQVTPSTKRAIQGKVPKVVTLRDSYLKVEDLSFKYRPLVHEFKVWPEITFDSSVICPFDRPRRRSSESNVAKRKSRTETQSIKRTSVQERPKHGYCECCEVRYTDLNAHLKSDQHHSFARTDSNYSSLDKAINDGPTIQNFLNELRLKKTKDYSSTVNDNSNLPVCDEKVQDEEMTDDVFLVSSPKHKSLPNVTSNSKPIMMEEFNPATCLEKNTNENGKNESIQENSNFLKCYTIINEKNTPVCEPSIDDREEEKSNPSRPITRSLTSPKEQPIDVVDKQRRLSDASHHRRENSNETLIRSQDGTNEEDGAVPLTDYRSKRVYNKGILKTPVRLTVENQSPSSSPQHLSKSSNKVNERPGESYRPRPFVLNEDTKIGTRRSHKRKRNFDSLKRPDGLELSPILPCDPRVGGSVSNSYGEEAGFLPSGLPIYSSVGSSCSDRIENQFNSESSKHRAGANNSDLASTPVCVKVPRRKPSATLYPGSVSDVIQHSNEKSEKPVLKVALAQLDTDIIARHNPSGGNNGEFPLIKRKRSLEDDLEHSKARKCKRLIEESGSESEDERNFNEFTLEDVFDDNFRSSVAERVKLQRALYESLQDIEMSAAEDPRSCPPSSPIVTMTRKKPRIVFSPSPFVEITNTCIKQRQRTKSDGKRSLKKSMEYRKEMKSLSACLTPNDPFSFTE